MNHQQKITYQYSLIGRFLSLIFLVFIGICFLLSWKINKIKREYVNNNIVHIVRNISQHINSNLQYTENKMHFIGDLIANQEIQNNSKEIQNLLKIFSSDEDDQTNLWKKIGWVDNQHSNLIVRDKIISFPKKRDYFADILQNPFKLIFSNYSKLDKIIPVAMGITDKNGKSIGSINSAIDVEKLEKDITNSVDDSIYYYALISNNDVIISSKEFKQDLFKNIDKSQELISSKIKQNYVLSQIKDYPFIIIIGTNKKIVLSYQDYLYAILPYRSELIFSLTLVLSLIYLFYVSILEPFMALAKAANSITNGEVIELEKFNSKEGVLVASVLEQINSSIQKEKDLVAESTEARNKLALTNLRLEKKVAERTLELERALMDKTAFIDYVNHETILPMRAIKDISENLISFWDEISEKKRFEFISQIAYSTNKLFVMVSDFLDLSRITSGRIKLNYTRFDLTLLIQDTLKECKIYYMNRKTVNINFLVTQEHYIVADKERMRQVLRNLITNAIKFSPTNGDIAINITTTRINLSNHYYNALQFSICDRGIGLDEIELENIFNSYSQGKTTKSISGSVGLGLTICREIITGHSGKIWASNNKDGGATFNFLIPVAQPNNNTKPMDLNTGKINLVIIDDEEVCLNSMELLLHNSEYNLIKINSGLAGLKYLQQNHQSISLVMLDLMMPDIYGLNVISELKKDPKLTNIPIMLQTGISDEEEIRKAFEMGISCFIRKPYNKQMVLNEIKKALKRV